MNNSTQLLKLFHTGFTVCLALGIIFLLVSILLFVKFDIKGIWELRSGRARARAIKEKQEEAALSGKLRTGKKPVPELKKSGQLKEMAQAKAQPEGQMEASEQPVEETGVLDAPNAPVIQTASAQLQEGTDLTMALNPRERQIGAGKFLIERQIIHIHTEEVI